MPGPPADDLFYEDSEGLYEDDYEDINADLDDALGDEQSRSCSSDPAEPDMTDASAEPVPWWSGPRRTRWRGAATVPVADDAMSAVLEADDELTTHRFVQDTEESVTLYLSTPLWVRVELVESGRRPTEIPSHRMSDTWFGPSTREGTLCYATRTAGRLRLDRLPRRLHRALTPLTPLTVQNRTAEPLVLERIQLLMLHLSLYVTVDDPIWTDPVTITHRTKGEGAAVQVRERPPSERPAAESIQAPREDTRHGLFTSTFSAVGVLFGP